jgi:hypothetical protein
MRNASWSVLLLLLSACKSDPAPIAPVREEASAAAAPSAAASAAAASAASEPSSSASAALATSAAPEASASASSGNPVAASSASAAPADASASVAARPPQPRPPSGILAKGAADKILKNNAPPKITVLAAGAEPRQRLSYAFEKGTKDSLTVAMDLSMAMKSGDTTLPATALPRMSLSLLMTNSATSDGGDFKIDAQVDSFNLQPKGPIEEQIAASVKPQLEGIKGVVLSYWMTPQGHVRDLEMKSTGGADGMAQQALNGMNQSFESMAVPLPKEPVGVGGKWEVVSRLASSGADLLQYATYTLKARDGSKANIDLTVTQLAASSEIHAPGMPENMTARLKSFRAGGGGSTEIDTKAITPRSGTLAVESAMSLTVAQGGGADEVVNVETKVKMQFLHPTK